MLYEDGAWGLLCVFVRNVLEKRDIFVPVIGTSCIVVAHWVA